MNNSWLSQELKDKLSKRIKEGQKRNNAYEKIRQASIEHWKDKDFKEKVSNNIKLAYMTGDIKEKQYQTKKKNNTFNTSQPEQQTYTILQSIFDNVQTQYHDERYPFNCDFYIPSLDLFIECNYHWTHQNEPYDENNPEHQNIVESWRNKNTEFYNIAIDVWTRRDVEKMKCAHENKLNYIVFYSFEEFIKWSNEL